MNNTRSVYKPRHLFLKYLKCVDQFLLCVIFTYLSNAWYNLEIILFKKPFFYSFFTVTHGLLLLTLKISYLILNNFPPVNSFLNSTLHSVLFKHPFRKIRGFYLLHFRTFFSYTNYNFLFTPRSVSTSLTQSSRPTILSSSLSITSSLPCLGYPKLPLKLKMRLVLLICTLSIRESDYVTLNTNLS